MEEILMKLKNILEESEATCVIGKNSDVCVSKQKGLKPLIQFYNENKRGYYAADKVVGKAAAFIHVLLKTKAVYTDTISVSGLQVLKQHNIPVYYREKVEIIANREKSGMCPMEKAVKDIDDPVIAYAELMNVIQSKKNN
ncbi:MAG: DUF1893 domain-containing protein [Erysipelotrichia bacterium]|nr:DUF1893 domain-containing protein [Erysipelotrichia bacterium]